MKTIETRVYYYEELDGSAKNNALSYFSDINLDDDWWQPTYETWRENGVVIKSFDLYKDEVELDFTDEFVDVATSIASFFGEVNDNYKFAQDYLNAIDNLTEDEIEDANDLFYSDLQDCIAHWLNNEFDYLLSEEAVEDAIIDREIMFTKDGRVFDYE